MSQELQKQCVRVFVLAEGLEFEVACFQNEIKVKLIIYEHSFQIDRVQSI